MDRQEMRILLLEGIHENAAALFKQYGFEQVESVTQALEGEDLQAALARADVVGIRSRTQLSQAVLAQVKHLQAIGCFCIGTNQVAVDKAQALGIPVFNAPYSNTRSVAELVLAEIICLLRGLTDKNHKVHTGTWPKTALGAYEARGKVLGIVGYGNIGTQLSVLAEGLGMRVIYHDVLPKLPLGNAEPARDLDDLLSRADVVSLHVPQLSSTYNMIAQAQLQKMKQGALLINAARGHCVDIEALDKALREKHLGGCALDVFPDEPKRNDEALECSLRGLDNVILTPHIGGSTVEAQANIGIEVADKLVRFLQNGTTTGAVNFPEITMTKQQDTHRILHVHHNQPGVLSAVNTLFAQHAINITAQSLITQENIGYLITDVAVSDSDVALAQIERVEGTIRVRRLY
ncbi:phosphoglycerate dehydrogenase [Rappaport israeli]|uniref:phosphoglycerate dehydrogenase n=1 Tax=Rappaport israeli TaxID=1839807 RepID=UPI0009307B74|nr:phosphoglycerate dehydrogenase [Rappaport israeli]